ncbi:histone-lysine N-methyltransferase, H3 lysine-79 specific-like isoform X4 [Bolinopsis microptera]|uniref:histone-lysine N-methyltransferase, H3 lysine-79 specific-like isoform X4 n=1 Tax=Bolinopsis microptera TaxID=2820187 RepID=UPI00307A8011
MDFDALMAQARANEEQVKKKPKKPCNLEPARSTQKLRTELVRKQEEEKRRKIAEEERFGRQEREKLARMEHEMAEHERKLIEEQEKMDRLDQICKEAQERKAKMEAEQQAKRDAVRHEQENKREEEREKKRCGKGKGGERFGDFIDDDDDIFKRRQREVDEKKRRRDERKKDDIWRRREEHKRGMKDRDKEKLMAKIREDAKKVAMSLSKSMDNRGSPSKASTPEKTKKRTSSSSASKLLDIEESAYHDRKRAETSSSSEDEEAAPQHRRRESSHSTTRDTPNSSYKQQSYDRRSVSAERDHGDMENGDEDNAAAASTSRNKPKVSDILGGNVNTAALSAALNQFIKYPSGPIAEMSDAEYDSHEEQNNQSPQHAALAPLFKPTSSVTSELQYSPLDSVFSESLTSQTLASQTPTSQTLSSQTLNTPRASDSLFKETLVSETTYSPRNITGEATPCLSYSPSVIPAKYSPENFSDMKTSIEYIPSSVNESALDSIAYTPGPSRYMTVDYTPTREMLTSETQSMEYVPAVGTTLDNNMEYSPAPMAISANLDYSPQPETPVSEDFRSPCTLQSETVYSPNPIPTSSPAALLSDTVYTSAYLQSETFISPSAALPPQTATWTTEPSPDSHQPETLVSETVTSSPSQFVFSPSKITPSLDNFCYSPLKTTEIDLLKSPTSKDPLGTRDQPEQTEQLESETRYSPEKMGEPQYSPEKMGEPQYSPEKPKYSPNTIETENRTSSVNLETDNSPNKNEIENSRSLLQEGLETETKYSPETVETETSYTPSKPCPNESQYSPGTVDSNIHYSPCPQYVPEPLNGEEQHICYTPARPVQMTPNETEMNCEMTPARDEPNELPSNETELYCEATPKQNIIEMTPNETEMNCEMTPETPNQNEKSPPRKEKEQEKLQELFGDTDSEGEEKKSDSEEETEKKQYESEEDEEEEEEEEDSPAKKAQERRNKLKELSRKKNKHYSSDSLSDYDHKEYDETVEETKQPDKPKTFEEIMAMAKLKGEENKKELELKKQREQNVQLQKKEKEAKRKMLREEMERKRKEAELEQEKEKRRQEQRRREEIRNQEQKKEERAKNRIPKNTAEIDKPRAEKHSNKQTDAHRRPNAKLSESKQSFKIPKSNGSAEHPNKRKKMSAPKPDPTGSGSFEELMMLAQNNSKQGTFGSSIRKPEDVLREQKKKEAQREREKQQFLNFKVTVPPPPPKQKQPPPRPSSKPLDRSLKPVNREDRSSKERGKEHRKEQKGSDTEREHRRLKEAKRRPEKPKKKMHANPYMDDDLDDFVVSDGEDIDVSKAVRNIFGYDKRKYRDEEDDCRNMETDYRTIAQEEARSARLAKKEDADELKKILAEEEREKKRKMKR